MCAAEFFEAGEAFVEHVEGGAVAQADAVVVAKSDTRNGSDAVASE